MTQLLIIPSLNRMKLFNETMCLRQNEYIDRNVSFLRKYFPRTRARDKIERNSFRLPLSFSPSLIAKAKVKLNENFVTLLLWNVMRVAFAEDK